MRKKVFLFRGSRDRLHRMVQRHGGRIDSTGRFELLWKPDHYKQHHVLSFRICGHCEKREDGYRITYRILPTGFSALRIAIPLALLLGVMLIYFPGSGLWEYGTILFLMGMIVLTAFWQLRESEKAFLSRFTKATE